MASGTIKAAVGLPIPRSSSEDSYSETDKMENTRDNKFMRSFRILALLIFVQCAMALPYEVKCPSDDPT